MANSIFFRKGTAAHWATSNPILRDGEPGYEKDTGKMKVGDGVTAWNSLEYHGDSTEWTDWVPIISQGSQLTIDSTKSFAKFYKSGKITHFMGHLVPMNTGTLGQPITITGIPESLQTILPTMPTENGDRLHIGEARWGNAGIAHHSMVVVAYSPTEWRFLLYNDYAYAGTPGVNTYTNKTWDAGDAIQFHGFIVL